jgi:hypothetical protein
VHSDGGRSVVYEMDGAKQVAHPVTVGLSAGSQTQITDGLPASTRIVLPAASTGPSAVTAIACAREHIVSERRTRETRLRE